MRTSPAIRRSDRRISYPATPRNEIFSRYQFLFFLGRNCMNGELYGKLVCFVKNGGQLLMTAAHLNTSLLPQGEYEPYLNGNWSELFGVRIRSREDTRLPYGIKFKAVSEGGMFRPGSFCRYESAPGSILYLLNTEENLVQEVIVHHSATCRNSLRLLPGEIREITVR